MERLIMKLLMLLLILFLVVFLVGKMIDKLLGIKRKDISETPGKSIDRWGRTLILFIFIWSAFTEQSDAILKWQWVLFLTALVGFQTILEWKYLKGSKQYISTLISSIITFFILVFFVQLYR